MRALVGILLPALFTASTVDAALPYLRQGSTQTFSTGRPLISDSEPIGPKLLRSNTVTGASGQTGNDEFMRSQGLRQHFANDATETDKPISHMYHDRLKRWLVQFEASLQQWSTRIEGPLRQALAEHDRLHRRAALAKLSGKGRRASVFEAQAEKVLDRAKKAAVARAEPLIAKLRATQGAAIEGAHVASRLPIMPYDLRGALANHRTPQPTQAAHWGWVRQQVANHGATLNKMEAQVRRLKTGRTDELRTALRKRPLREVSEYYRKKGRKWDRSSGQPGYTKFRPPILKQWVNRMRKGKADAEPEHRVWKEGRGDPDPTRAAAIAEIKQPAPPVRDHVAYFARQGDGKPAS